jgi:histidine triad (HIT) family protein
VDCIFCKIVNGEIPANIIYQDDTVIAFEDIKPKAPHHKLIIPKKHIATLNDVPAGDTALLGHMMQTAKQLASSLGIAEDGYRVVMNCNKGGGQEVFHIHLHLLGGRSLNWPPG